MLSCVLTAITCSAIPVSDPLEISAVMPANEPTVAVGTYVTSTSFRSRNFSSSDCMLLFGDESSSSPVIVVLPAGGVVEYEFAPQALIGVNLEVISLNGTAMSTSGAVPLALSANTNDQGFWNVAGASGLVTWKQNGCEVSLVSPLGSMMPSGWGAEGPDPGACAAAQAPIAIPTRVIGPGVEAEPYLPM